LAQLIQTDAVIRLRNAGFQARAENPGVYASKGNKLYFFPGKTLVSCEEVMAAIDNEKSKESK